MKEMERSIFHILRLPKRARMADNRGLRGKQVYLAARFARQAELREVAEELRQAGAGISSRWLQSPEPLDNAELNPASRGSEMALMDIADLRRSDICIAFTENGQGPGGRGGRHTELGIALGLGMPVIVVGPREHVFHCLPEVEQYPTWADARHNLLGGDGVVHFFPDGRDSSAAPAEDDELAIL